MLSKLQGHETEQNQSLVIKNLILRRLSNIAGHHTNGRPTSHLPINFRRFRIRFQVSEGTIRCLAALPLRIREDERARAKARVKSNNRKRRREGGVEAGLMEADANVDGDLRAKCQADALHEASQTESVFSC